MKEETMGRFTPQRKIIGVNDRFGNTGIRQQQGSTVVKYDMLPWDGRTEYRFFEGSSQRNFPFSNTGSDGNKLGVGSSMVIERAYLTIVQADPDTGIFSDVAALSIGNYPELCSSEFFFEIANSQVIKSVPVLSWLPEFNKDAENALNSSFEFDTQVIIPPLLEFVATIRTNAKAPLAPTYLRLTIEGTGAIIAPRTTF
jgi:hypothetical protein